MDAVSLILALAAKDWRLFLADRRAALLGFAVPIVLASAFGLIFAKTPGQSATPRLQLLVVCESHGPLTEQILADMLASPRLQIECLDRAEAERRVSDRRPGIAVILPASFETLNDWKPLPENGTAQHNRPTLEIIHNPLAESEGQWAEGVLSELLMRRLARERLAPLLGNTVGEISLPFSIQARVLSGSVHATFNSYTHSFCGMTLQYLLFWGMESGLLLLRERQRSLWLRLRAAPVPLWTVLVGKTLSTGSIALLQVLVTFAFGYLVFDVRVSGSWIGFALLAIGVSFLAAATGLLVAAIGGTEARARNVCILVILGVSMLGGLWLPSFVLPSWARDLALSLPTTWAMRGLDAVTWQGQGFLTAVPSIGMVSVFSAVFLSVAVARLVSSETRRRRGLA